MGSPITPRLPLSTPDSPVPQMRPRSSIPLPRDQGYRTQPRLRRADSQSNPRAICHHAGGAQRGFSNARLLRPPSVGREVGEREEVVRCISSYWEVTPLRCAL